MVEKNVDEDGVHDHQINYKMIWPEQLGGSGMRRK